MKLRFFCILIMLVIPYFIYTKYTLLEVQQNGKIVEMTIVEMPHNCESSRRSFFMEVMYGNHTYRKRIPSGYCKKHFVGDKVQLKYLQGKQSVLFPDETQTMQFVALGLIFLVACIGAILPLNSSRSKQNKVNQNNRKGV